MINHNINTDILLQIQNVLESRKHADPNESYTAQLLHKGQDKILKKIIEEAGEVLMASKDLNNNNPDNPDNLNQNHVIYEVADLWFHSMILLTYHGLSVESVLNELARRQGLSGLAEKASREHK